MARPPLPLGTWGEINVKKVSERRYRARARYRDYDGRTRPVEARGTTKAGAKRNLRTKLGDRATPDSGPATRDSRLSVLAELYFEEAKLGESSRYQYRSHWDRRIKPALGELRIREITPSGCVAFLSTYADRPSLATTLRVVLTNILATGVRLDLLPANPAAATVKPQIASAPKSALSLDEVRELRRLVAAYDSNRRSPAMLLDFLDIMLGTGLRISEVAPLRWDGVDFEERTITVIEHSIYVPGGAKLAAATKSADVDRTLVVPAFVIASLRHRRDRVAGDWVFPSPRLAGRPIVPGTISQHLADARGADFADVTSHTFRRTVATLINAEADAEAAAQQLGHASSRTTLRYYIARPETPPDLSDILNQLE